MGNCNDGDFEILIVTELSGERKDDFPDGKFLRRGTRPNFDSHHRSTKNGANILQPRRNAEIFSRRGNEAPISFDDVRGVGAGIHKLRGHP